MSTDFQGTFQKKFHSKVIPGLLSILDDHENPRTQAHGGAALVNFAEDCPPRLLVEHLPQIIEKLENVLGRKYQEVIEYFVDCFQYFCFSNSLFNIIVNWFSNKLLQHLQQLPIQ
jgi:hypothetical protein